MKYCEKCLARNGNLDFFVMTLQTSCGAFRQREREREREKREREREREMGYKRIVVLKGLICQE